MLYFWHFFPFPTLYYFYEQNISPCGPLVPPPPHKNFLKKMFAYLVCFGVRFNLYLASWFFSVCVVFDPLFFLQKMGGGQLQPVSAVFFVHYQNLPWRRFRNLGTWYLRCQRQAGRNWGPLQLMGMRSAMLPPL